MAKIMKLSDLIDFIEESIPAAEFARLINAEVDTYKKVCEKTGSSAEVLLHGNTKQKLEIGKDKLCIICRLYLGNILTEWDVYYLCDVLLLAEQISFLSEDIREAIEGMTDPMVNGKLTRERVTSIFETCS